MAIINLKDFSGGYFTDTPNELMKDNELLIAENCEWNNAMVKRNGISTYSTGDLSGFTGCKGGIRVYLNSTWYTILAFDDGSHVNFYYGTGTTFTAIDNDFDWTTGETVEMAELDGYVVCVNGTDKPAVIYYDGGLTIENLETLDTRKRNNINWFAGQWDNSETETFVDDTTDARDAGADDFQIGANVTNDGCYIACDFVFNKVVFSSAEQATGSPVAEWAYWTGSAWQTFTPGTNPTWTSAAGDRTVEFDLPLDSDGSLLWEVYGESSNTDGVENKYILRLRFTTEPDAAFSCDSLSVYHTQYLTQMLANDRPHFVCTHNTQIYMAAGNIINFSPPHSVTGWREGQAEYFIEGGEKIISCVSHKDSLVVFKENTIYTFNTTNLQDPIRSRPLTSVGCVAARSPKMVGGIVCFVGIDGLYVWDGNLAVKVSKHIQTDIDSYTLSTACGVNYKNKYYVAFPSASEALVFDVDTFRTSAEGDGIVSVNKFTNYKASGFLNCNATSDTGYLLVFVDQSTPYLARCDNGAYDNVGSITNISMRVKTKYYGLDNFQNIKYFGRFKPDVAEVSGFSGRRHKIVLYGDNGRISKSLWMLVPKGDNHYSEDIMIPYTIDGKNISIELRHSQNTSATLYGYAFNTNERRF